ncbi:LacI family DNA-binding transcriptional regulator [Paracoccus sp. 11-3]|uniref:LacI family DNA-binding transcriptional regulator n=1 Tax=Paracoccus amoyensis TaxID=2760093 RepID=A0A926G5Y3_9RHOB|nr:LacI family DNA-binding transcriptional regulator [Paracoccus amoyensis]MBC9245178.1 LacI family DNA-binding transcriptional regulator [Paracoccus amoyensis]
MGHKSTAQDVAREAGVSASTVDRVLNNRGGVSEAKERRVFAAARRLQLDRALDPRAARTLRIAAFVQPPTNPFHAALATALQAQNRGPNPFNIQSRIFHADAARADETARRVAAAGAEHDAIIICLPHDVSLALVLQRLADSGKPVVTLATDIRCRGATYVGPDNHKAGRLAAELMGRFLGQAGGDVIVIAGLLTMIGQEERQAGFQQVLAERHPNCRITGVFESREKGDLAGDLVYRALRRNPLIRGVYNESAGATSVVDALRRLGRLDDVVFITHELTADRRPLLQSGAIDAVIDQNPELEVETALRVIAAFYNRAEGDGIPAITPVNIYTRENC